MVMRDEDPTDHRERQASLNQFERRAIARVDYMSDAPIHKQV
jgi:hypothetical protein